MNDIRFKRPTSAMIVRYKKCGENFRDFFLSFPLSTDSRITHYLFLSSHFDSGESPVASSHKSNPVLGPGHTSSGASAGSTDPLPPLPSAPTEAEQAYYSVTNVSGSAPPEHSQSVLPPAMSTPFASTHPQAAVFPSASGPAGDIASFQLGGLKRRFPESAAFPAKHSKNASSSIASTGGSK